jgi:hypothetical protein
MLLPLPLLPLHPHLIEPDGRCCPAAHPQRMRKVAIDAMRAGPWEGPVDQCKGAELYDVGGEEDDDELPPVATSISCTQRR